MARSGSEDCDAIFSSAFVPDASFPIVQIDIFMKDEQAPRLLQHRRCAARRELADAIGDDVLNRNDRGPTFFPEIDQDDPVAIGHAIEQGRTDHFEPQLQIRMDSAQGRMAGGSDERTLVPATRPRRRRGATSWCVSGRRPASCIVNWHHI